MTELMPGPCTTCGAKDYPLSTAGPEICPTCDCGDSYSSLRRQIVQLQTENAKLRETVREYEEFTKPILGDE